MIKSTKARGASKRKWGSRLLSAFAVLCMAGGAGLLWWNEYGLEGEAPANIASYLEQWDAEHGDAPESTDVPPVRNYDDPQGSDDRPEYGTMYGVLHVPSWNHMRIPTFRGSDQADLDKGWLGIDEDSPYPGRTGVSVGFGHRRTNGSNLRRIDELEPGDHVILETDSAYIVFDHVETEMILPTDVEKAYSRPSGRPEDGRYLNLVTCTSAQWGAYGNDHRYVARFQMNYWVSKSDGVAPELFWPR